VEEFQVAGKDGTVSDAKDGIRKYPLVTVITPTFNRTSYLEETIESVLSQGYPALDYIVIDDGSTDDTQALLSKYAGRIRSFHHPNQGEVNAINRGLALATGEILGIVSSDDPLLPGAIWQCVTALQEDSDAVVVYSDWRVIGPASESVQDVALPDYDIQNMLRVFQTAITSGAFFRRSLLEAIGPRDSSLRYAHDLDFWLRAALYGDFVHVRQVLTTHREHPGCQYHSAQGKRYADEIVRTVDKLFKQRNLPAAVARLRATALGNAHGLAALYCGSSRWVRAQHLTLAFCYQPMKRSRQLVRYLNCISSRLFWRTASSLYHRMPGALQRAARAVYCGLRRGRAKAPQPTSSQRGPSED
jgi:glycosyltransferase involved in cell wall biosynthesis